jgi:hypothetical protein
MDEQELERKSGAGSIVLIILFLLVVLASGAAVYFYRQMSAIRDNPQKVAQEEVDKAVERVGVLMVLPEEQPTLATVNDPARLANQPFFSKAKTGDQVLIYPNAQKAILYDPVANKIIDVAPINIGNQ